MNLEKIPIERDGDSFNVVIEVAAQSSNKYEYDSKTETFKIDKLLVDGLVFPYNYGFIPQTSADDGDLLDAFVLSSEPLNMGCIIKVKPIGLIELIDDGEPDNKLITVPVVLGGNKQPEIVDDSMKEIFKKFFTELAKQKRVIMEIKSFKDTSGAIKELERCLN